MTYLSAAEKAEAIVAEIEAEGRRGLAIPADGADPGAVVSAVERTVDEFGRLDVLVNNAGIFPNGETSPITSGSVAFLVMSGRNGPGRPHR